MYIYIYIYTYIYIYIYIYIYCFIYIIHNTPNMLTNIYVLYIHVCDYIKTMCRYNNYTMTGLSCTGRTTWCNIYIYIYIYIYTIWIWVFYNRVLQGSSLTWRLTQVLLFFCWIFVQILLSLCQLLFLQISQSTILMVLVLSNFKMQRVFWRVEGVTGGLFWIISMSRKIKNIFTLILLFF